MTCLALLKWATRVFKNPTLSPVLLLSEILVLSNAYQVFIEEDRKPFAERDVL